jgi:sigma-B regulation protein RsbU (phosphoserine phosphatase)
VSERTERGGNQPTDGYLEALLQDDPEELYETAPCGYLSTDPSGTIVKVNRTFLDWTGFRADELLHRQRFQALLAVGDRIFYETHFAPSLGMQGPSARWRPRSCAPRASGCRCCSTRCAWTTRPVVTSAPASRSSTPGSAAPTSASCWPRGNEPSGQRSRPATSPRPSSGRCCRRPSAIHGVDIGGAYRPAGDGTVVGGDFYDVFEIQDGSWGVVLGDVCGKGASAAIATALARYTIRALAVRLPQPSEVLRGLHDAIARSGTGGFCTALYLTARSDEAGLHLCLSAGGHHLPLRVDTDGQVAEVGRTGHMLGMLEPVVLHDEDVLLAPGDAVVLYTDGSSKHARTAPCSARTASAR